MMEFLPIEAEEFRIVYSIENERYRIRIKRPDPIPEEEKQQIVTQALEKLKENGVDTENLNYSVLMQNE